MLLADITIKETESLDNYCDSGHIAKKDINNNAVRFFHINTPTLTGIYCEQCIVLAQFIRKTKKEMNK